MTLRPEPAASGPAQTGAELPAPAGTRYRLERILGHGSNGSVWLGKDEVLQRPVAIKLTGDQADGETSRLRRFAEQARLAAALWHPNLVQIYDFGVAGERAFLVMEYLPGGSLGDRLHAGEMAVEDLRRLAGELLSALSYLHRQDLVHGDLSAGRVLLDADGRAHLSGFPQATAGAAGPADDLFALGQLLAGASAANAAEGRARLAATAPGRDAERALSDLIGGLLAPASASRFRTADEALESLRVCSDPDGQATQEFDVLAALDSEPQVKITGRMRSGSRWTRQRVLTAIGRYPVP